MKRNVVLNKDTKQPITFKNISVIPVPIYRCSVELFFSEDTKKINEMGWTKTECAMATDYMDTRTVMIRFAEKNITTSTYVHELTHATQMILDDAGHNYCKKDPDEPFAYLLSYLIDEFEKIVSKRKDVKLIRRK